MAYTQAISISLGASKTGLTLNGQLIDSAGASVGAAITTGFTEQGSGNYLLSASIPDDHRGALYVYDSANSSVILAQCAINPEDAQNVADILGLVGKQYGMRNASYSGRNLLSYDICIYDTAGHAATNDGATGLVHKYSVVNTYNVNGDILTSITTKVS